MKNNWFLILILTLSISACVNEQEKISVLETEHPEDMIFEISNADNYPIEFSMHINDLDLSSDYKIVEYIRNMPEDYPGEPMELKAFRFVHDYTWKDSNVTNQKILHNPSVMINSFGGGLCGSRSAVLTNILRLLGFKARSICLEGHVISEVFVNNRWQVLDVDYGVYYYNNSGDIASCEELSENPEIFHDIDNFKALGDFESILLNSYVLNNEELYSSVEDNKIFNTDYSLETNQSTFVLPPKSSFLFPYENCGRGDFFTTAKLEVSAEWKGLISVPFVLERIEGQGILLINGQKIKCDGSLINFQDLDFLGNKIEIVESTSEFKFYYFINPLVYGVRKSNTISFKGDNLSNLSIQLVEEDKSNLYYHPSYRDYLLELSFSQLKALSDSRGDELFSSRESTIQMMCELCNDSTELLSRIQFESFDGVKGSDTIALREYFGRELGNFFDRNCTSPDN